MKNKHIMVTGAGGFIGNNISNYLCKNKFNVHAYYNSKIKRIKNKNIRYLKRDLTKNIKINNKISTLVHCAALTPPTFDQIQCLKINQKIDDRILRAIKKSNINKIIFLSSMSAYGKKKKKTLFENTKSSNLDFYGKSKLLMEKKLKLLSKKNNINVIVLRLSAIIGSGCHSTFLSRLSLEIKKKEINIYNSQSFFNGCIHINNLNMILIKLLNRDFTGFDVLNIFSSNPVKIITIFNLFKKKLNKEIKFNIIKKKTNQYTISSLKFRETYRLPLTSTIKNIKMYLKELKN